MSPSSLFCSSPLLAGGYCGFHRGNPFRSLIRCHVGCLRHALLGTSRVSAKIEIDGRGREGEIGVPSFRVSRPRPPRHNFVNYCSLRSSASRIIQNGSHEKRTPEFLAERKTPTPIGRLFLTNFSFFFQRSMLLKRRIV